MLEVKHLETSYGSSQVLYGVELHIDVGQVVTLMGRNGMGKTTTIKSICGIVAPQAGSIILEGLDIAGLPSHTIARAGIGLVPEGRQIFPNLTVKENLVATAHNLAGSLNPWTIDRVLDFFPSLASRINGMGNELSGGEQQMLAIGRAIMTNPKLLILDEATEGLAPQIRADIWLSLAELKSEGQAILVIDKNLAALNRIADQHFIIEK
ncbi:MAG: ABC transporter ATP-binding protein, partial [Gammaproteobacteria bacterium]|nr:ABC transporter ATP-binding protein [Gammaproteobacteria bacterium]